jgi:hypothetical protein
MTDNMEIWNAVEKTDPKHTKAVNQRGGFTAIGANYQIMNATKQFGPVGVGWGYHTEKLERMDTMIVAHVTFWHGNRDNVFGPILGCAEMFGKKADSDAPKKAMTDAITKALSQLGFNADVFLGKFDDNKYVADVDAEFREAERPQAPQSVIDAAHGAETLESLGQVWTANKQWQTDQAFVAAKDKRKTELQQSDQEEAA